MAVEALEMSVEADDLPEAISGSGTLGIIGGPALSMPPPQRTPPPPSFSSLGPPFLPLPAGQGPTVARGLGEGKREVGLGGGLPPGNVTLPGPRIAPGPKPGARPGTRRWGSAGWGYFYLLSPLLGTTPPPDTLLCSLTLESPTHPIPALILSPSFVNTGL